MTRALARWSRWANSQSSGERRRAEIEAQKIANRLRKTGDWRKFVYDSLSWCENERNYKLCSEAIIRELEVTSLEEIVMKNMLGG